MYGGDDVVMRRATTRLVLIANLLLLLIVNSFLPVCCCTVAEITTYSRSVSYAIYMDLCTAETLCLSMVYLSSPLLYLYCGRTFFFWHDLFCGNEIPYRFADFPAALKLRLHISPYIIFGMR